MRRRKFFTLSAGVACALLAPASGAAEGRAPGAGSRAEPGTTIEIAAEHAPFPAASGKYSDRTVLVFVPSFYRLPKSRRVDFVVHFHGHTTTAAGAMVAHKLREQLTASRQNAILVVPQGPVRAADGDFGKLMTKGGLARLLDEVRRELGARAALELGTSSRSTSVGRVVLSAHSGGYRAVAAALRRGGTDVREAYLFDALYGELDTFASFVAAAPKARKLVSYHVGGKPRELSEKLADALSERGVRVVRELEGHRLTRADLVRGRAVFLAGRASHAGATYEELALRDCLFASCLEGRGSDTWHADRRAARAT